MSQFYLALILHIHDLNISKPQLLNFHNHPLLDHKLVLRFSHLKQIHPHLLYSIPTKTSLQTQHQLRLQSYLLLCLETLIIEDLTLTSQHLGHPLLSNPPFGLFNFQTSMSLPSTNKVLHKYHLYIMSQFYMAAMEPMCRYQSPYIPVIQKNSLF